MVEAKLAAAVGALALALSGCCSSPEYVWEAVPMDGSLTGVTAVVGPDYNSALGTLDSVYTAPNGKVFDCGSTPLVAKALLDVQPKLSYLKEQIGYSPEEMIKKAPECALSNWAADCVRYSCEALAGKPVDIAITNFGGIRADMPQGDILVDDIVAMFPFKNYPAVVEIKGSDVRAIFRHLCKKGKMQAVSGVRVVAEDGKLKSLEVGGRPLDDKKIYRVGTLDFMLDGGDGLYIARNARSLKISDEKFCDWLVPYLRTMYASGEEIKGEIEGRVTIK